LRLLVPLLFLFLFSCNNAADKKCKYGTPTPVFSKEISAVLDHSFEAKDQVSTEQATFENGMHLQLQQSGCNDIKQVFQFTIERPGEGEPNWFLLVADQFLYLSGISDQTVSLGMWASVISSNASLFKFGLPIEVEKGFFVKIDKIDSGKNAILLVELSENPYPKTEQQ